MFYRNQMNLSSFSLHYLILDQQTTHEDLDLVYDEVYEAMEVFQVS